MKHKLTSRSMTVVCIMFCFFLNVLGQGKSVTMTADHERLVQHTGSMETFSYERKLQL